MRFYHSILTEVAEKQYIEDEIYDVEERYESYKRLLEKAKVGDENYDKYHTTFENIKAELDALYKKRDEVNKEYES